MHRGYNVKLRYNAKQAKCEIGLRLNVCRWGITFPCWQYYHLWRVINT